MVEKISNRFKEVALCRSDTVNHLVTSYISNDLFVRHQVGSH